MMAKHLREEELQPTEAMPYSQPTAIDTEGAVTYREEEYLDDYYDDDYLPARGGIRKLGRGILLLLAWVMRLGAIFVCGLVIVNALSPFSFDTYLEPFMDRIWALFPWGSIQTLAVDTPFGGTFYGDLALGSVGLFVLDWLFCLMRTALV